MRIMEGQGVDGHVGEESPKRNAFVRVFENLSLSLLSSLFSLLSSLFSLLSSLSSLFSLLSSLFSLLSLSCRVVSCRVVSCRVLSCLVLSCLVLSCLVLSCLVLSCLVVCVCVCVGVRVCWRVCVGAQHTLRIFPQECWSTTALSGTENDRRNREHVVLDLFSNFQCERYKGFFW